MAKDFAEMNRLEAEAGLHMVGASKNKAALSGLMKAWESKNAKRALQGAGLTTMAVTLAACGGSDDTAVVPTTPVEPVEPVDPVAPTAVLSTLQQAAFDFGVAITVAGDAADVVDLKAGADSTVLALNGATRAITNDFDAEVAAGTAFGLTAIVLDDILGTDALILDSLRAINDNLDDTLDDIDADNDNTVSPAEIAGAANGDLSSLWTDASFALTPGNAAAGRAITEFLEEFEATVGFRQLSAERALDGAIDALGDLTNDQEDAVAAIVAAGATIGAASVNADLNIVADDVPATTVELAAGVLAAARGVNSILTTLNTTYADEFDDLSDADQLAVLNLIGDVLMDVGGTPTPLVAVNELNGQVIGLAGTNNIFDVIVDVEAGLAGATLPTGLTVSGADTSGNTDGTFVEEDSGALVGLLGLGTEAAVALVFDAAVAQAQLETAVEAFDDVFALLQARAEANIAVDTAFQTLDLVERAENGDVEFFNLFGNVTATEADDIIVFAADIMEANRTITDFAEDGDDTIVFVGEYTFVELEDGATTNFNEGVGSASDLEIFWYVTTGGNTVLLVEDVAFKGSVTNEGNLMTSITLVDYDATDAIEAAFSAGGATILTSEAAVVA